MLQAAAKNSAAFTTLGLAATAAGGAIFLGLSQAASAAMSFESSFAGVRKTVDGTEAELQVIAEGMRELAREIPVPVEELNRVGESAGQLGIAKGAILDFTETIALLGVTTNMSSEQAADDLARLANITQMPMDQVDRLGSTVVFLGNKLAATESELTDFGLRIAAAGSIAGLTEANILAISGAMASVGIESERGGTAVSKVLFSMTSAVNEGGEKMELFARTAGMSAQEFARTWREDPVQAFTAFVEGIGRAGQKGEGILRGLQLTDIRLIQAFLSLANAGDLLTRSVELGNKGWRENSALQEEAAKRFETTEMQVRLMMNRINDAMISLGNVLLPGISAAADVGGTVATVFADLPGPLHAVGAAFGGIAGAVLLVAGATMLLLPRIVAAKAALAAAGVQGGIFRGSLTLAGRALFSPLGIGLTVATVAAYAFGKSKQEAEARVQAFTEAIKADSGALGENTRAAVANELVQSGLAASFKEVGVPLAHVTDTILGLAAGNREAAEEFQHLADVLPSGDIMPKGILGLDTEGDPRIPFLGLAESLGDAREEALLYAESMGKSGEQNTAAAGAAGEHGEAIEGLGTEMEETSTLADQLTKALEELSGRQIDSEKAAITWRDAMRNLGETVKDGSKSLRGNSEEVDENKSAVLDAVDAAFAHGAAVAEETGSVRRGAAVVREHIQQLVNQADQLGMTRRQVKAYLESLNLTPDQIRTTVKLMASEAESELAGIQRAMREVDGMLATATVKVIQHFQEVRGGVHHHGGTIGESGPRRMHAGGDFGPMSARGNEILVLGERGEAMMSASKMRALENILAARPVAVQLSARAGDRRGGTFRVVGGKVRLDPEDLALYVQEMILQEVDAERDYDRGVAP